LKGVLLKDMARWVAPVSFTGAEEVLVTGVSADSRTTSPGDLFICIRGGSADGHERFSEALARGAVGVVAERKVNTGGAPLIVVEDTREAAGSIASHFFGEPSRRMKVVGVTGTDGKTTTCHFIRAIAEQAGEAAAVMGTLGFSCGSKTERTGLTTPDAVNFQRYLRRMADAGVSTAVVEVSSHALQLKRTWGTEFHVAAFTNLTRDHLDFHRTEEAYLEAKLKLFLPPPEGGRTDGPAWVVLNRDDPHFERFLEAAGGETIHYGLSAEADVRARDIKEKNFSSAFHLDSPGASLGIRLKMPGRFNVYNALAASAVAVCLGFPAASVKAGLESVQGVPGRMEIVRSDLPFKTVVDYAHTPEALDEVLRALRGITPGRVICVFGCGGDRDKEKRPLMGAAATRRADICFITSDNPRSEDPAAIIGDITAGIAPGVNNYRVFPDRKTAIREAIMEARPSDTVLIAGKGHETYQIVGREVLPFDDRLVAREAIEARARSEGGGGE